MKVEHSFICKENNFEKKHPINIHYCELRIYKNISYYLQQISFYFYKK